MNTVKIYWPDDYEMHIMKNEETLKVFPLLKKIKKKRKISWKFFNYNHHILEIFDNNFHNEEGPAVVDHVENPKPMGYYLNGKHFPKEEWEKEVNTLKFNKKLENIL